MKKLLSILLFSFLIVIFILLPKKAYAAEQLQIITDPVESYSNFSFQYSGLRSDLRSDQCYGFKIIHVASGNAIDGDQSAGLIRPCIQDDHSFYYSSNSLGDSGSLTFNTRNLPPADYELQLYLDQRSVGIPLQRKATTPFTTVSFSSSCSSTISPTDGIVEQTRPSVLVVGKFIANIDSITLQMVDAQSGDPLDSPFTPSLGPISSSSDSRIAGPIQFGPVHTIGSYKMVILAPKAPGQNNEQICESNSFAIDVDPNNPTPPPSTCSPPDIDPSTNTCIDQRCRITSAGRCELPFAALPTPRATPTPVGMLCLGYYVSESQFTFSAVGVNPTKQYKLWYPKDEKTYPGILKPNSEGKIDIKVDFKWNSNQIRDFALRESTVGEGGAAVCRPEPVAPTIPPFNPDYCIKDDPTSGIQTGIGCIKTSVSDFVKSIFGIVLSLAGGVALLLIIYSGYRMVVSAGNPEALQGARETITAAIIGLLFIIFAFVILQIIGVDILNIPGFGN